MFTSTHHKYSPYHGLKISDFDKVQAVDLPVRVVSYFTESYVEYYARFLDRVNLLSMESAFAKVSDSGDWLDNENEKPSAILKLLEASKKAILFVDIDTDVRTIPLMPAGEWDVGLLENPCRSHRNHIACQAIFFNYTPGAFRFLGAWDYMTKTKRRNSHPCMTDTIIFMRHHERDVRFVDAQEAMCQWVFNGLAPERKQA